MTLTPIYPHFLNEGVELLESAFPPIERRPLEDWKVMTENHKYFHAMAIVEKTKFCGILTFWDFGTFLYIEHFAIDSQLRNGGIGKTALELFLYEHQHMNIVLEVEMPDNDIARRRIGFYERNGFCLIEERDYLQPPYIIGGETLPLKLMGTQGSVTRNNYEDIVQKIHTNVYGV